MKLTLDQVRQITIGAADVSEEQGKIRFHRFTKEQDELYRVTYSGLDPQNQDANPDFYERSLTPAGVKLSFRTDSPMLKLKAELSHGTTRSYFSFDVFANGACVGNLDNFSAQPVPSDYTQAVFPLGRFEKTFSLGDGTKTVCIHLPWSVQVGLEELSLEDGAWFEGVKPERKLLMFGDSITQGYDALRPSGRYAARLAEALGAEEYNKAVGGEIFFPALARCRENFVPNLITVAYGTNDWNRTEREEFQRCCRAFYQGVRENYPHTPIIALSPIWREDQGEERAFGAFAAVEQDIRAITAEVEGVIFVSGADFVPQDTTLFGDGRLHPNDKGFAHYFEHVYAAIRAKID